MSALNEGTTDDRRYTRAELEEVAALSAEAVLLAWNTQPPDAVPERAISQTLGAVLADFDERRSRVRVEAQARQPATHDKSRCGGPRICSRCAREEAGEFNRVREAAREADDG